MHKAPLLVKLPECLLEFETTWPRCPISISVERTPGGDHLIGGYSLGLSCLALVQQAIIQGVEQLLGPHAVSVICVDRVSKLAIEFWERPVSHSAKPIGQVSDI